MSIEAVANQKTQEENQMETYKLRFTYGTSRARDTYGYNIVSLFVDGDKVASCIGGGYDMQGTVFGDWVASAFADKLNKLEKKEFYGLTFHDPNFDTGQAEIENGETVAEREAAGKSFGLERYQAFYSASSKTPTKTHTVPSIDGACGFSSVERIFEAIGGKLEHVKEMIYLATI